MALDFALTTAPVPTDQARIDEIFTNPGFGDHFTDHMTVATWTADVALPATFHGTWVAG